MKKYLLSALFWVFSLIGAFASADTVWDFTSESEIYYNSFDVSSNYVDLGAIRWSSELYSNLYYCLSISDFSTPFYVYFDLTETLYNLTSSNFCLSSPTNDYDNALRFYSDSEMSEWIENVSWIWYFSESLITINWNLSEWWDSSWSLLPWGEGDLSWIITWLNSTITEFIPYLVYLWLWIITVIIWFVAIRWLVNRTQAKIRWTFSSWRRRR